MDNAAFSGLIKERINEEILPKVMPEGSAEFDRISYLKSVGALLFPVPMVAGDYSSEGFGRSIIFYEQSNVPKYIEIAIKQINENETAYRILSTYKQMFGTLSTTINNTINVNVNSTSEAPAVMAFQCGEIDKKRNSAIGANLRPLKIVLDKIESEYDNFRKKFNPIITEVNAASYCLSYTLVIGAEYNINSKKKKIEEPSMFITVIPRLDLTSKPTLNGKVIEFITVEDFMDKRTIIKVDSDDKKINSDKILDKMGLDTSNYQKIFDERSKLIDQKKYSLVERPF